MLLMQIMILQIDSFGLVHPIFITMFTFYDLICQIYSEWKTYLKSDDEHLIHSFETTYSRFHMISRIIPINGRWSTKWFDLEIGS